MGSCSECGSALVIALLVSFILALLGLSFLLMAQTESRIAANERNALQAFYLAEAGSAVAQSWFDRPGSALEFPAPEELRRSLRELLDEDDPYQGSRTAGTRYKQIAATSTDVDLDNDGVVDLFRPPYRGGDAVEHAFMGARSAPDVIVDAADVDPLVGAFLDDLSLRILGPEFDGQGRRGKISRIAIHAPPYLPVEGNWTRFGIATVEVTARIYRLDADGDETDVLAQRTVSTVLNEIPYGAPVFGPLHACGDLQFDGPLNAHWGPVTTGGELLGYDVPSDIAFSIPRQSPPGPRVDRLWVTQPAQADCVLEYNGRATGDPVPDPWLRALARDSIDGATPLKPQPYDDTLVSYPDAGCTSVATAPTLDCCDRSNLFQFHPLVSCPVYDYEFWKSIARSGRSDVHYFVPDPPGNLDSFKEGGVGDSVSLQEATNGKTGLFFFDTQDALPPRDEDLDGDLENLVDAVITVTTDWQTAGFIYLNARVLAINGPLTPPQNVAVRAPGEPFLDANNNRRYDLGEAWVNLSYPTTAVGSFSVDAADDTDDLGGVGASGPVRNSQGPFEISLPVSFAGILYTGGDLTADGSGAFYGSVIARGEITLGSRGGGAPDFYWDERIFRQWPPIEEVGLPRVVATRWDQAP